MKKSSRKEPTGMRMRKEWGQASVTVKVSVFHFVVGERTWSHSDNHLASKHHPECLSKISLVTSLWFSHITAIWCRHHNPHLDELRLRAMKGHVQRHTLQSWWGHSSQPRPKTPICYGTSQHCPQVYGSVWGQRKVSRAQALICADSTLSQVACGDYSQVNLLLSTWDSSAFVLLPLGTKKGDQSKMFQHCGKQCNNIKSHTATL